MSMRKDLGRSRALRPSAESLEVRQLLSATVSGIDTAGDHWTLTLQGQGALQVIKQTDPHRQPAAPDLGHRDQVDHRFGDRPDGAPS